MKKPEIELVSWGIRQNNIREGEKKMRFEEIKMDEIMEVNGGKSIAINISQNAVVKAALIAMVMGVTGILSNR